MFFVINWAVSMIKKRSMYKKCAKFYAEHFKELPLTIKCLLATMISELFFVVREEIKFQIWARDGARDSSVGHLMTLEERKENARSGKIPEVGNRKPERDIEAVDGRSIEEVERELGKMSECDFIEFINKNRKKRSMVVVKKSTIEGAGLGLFAERDITEGERISGATYGGRIMTFKEACAVPAKEKDYVMALHLNVHIDAKDDYGYLARYINDTYKTDFERNCKFLKISEERRASVVAMSDIKKGDELFAEYGSGYWRARNGEILADEGEVENFKRDMEKAKKLNEGYKSRSKKTHPKEFNNAKQLLERQGKGPDKDSIFKPIK
jgi:hypothetical protein